MEKKLLKQKLPLQMPTEIKKQQLKKKQEMDMLKSIIWEKMDKRYKTKEKGLEMKMKMMKKSIIINIIIIKEIKEAIKKLLKNMYSRKNKFIILQLIDIIQ